MFLVNNMWHFITRLFVSVPGLSRVPPIVSGHDNKNTQWADDSRVNTCVSLWAERFYFFYQNNSSRKAVGTLPSAPCSEHEALLLLRPRCSLTLASLFHLINTLDRRVCFRVFNPPPPWHVDVMLIEGVYHLVNTQVSAMNHNLTPHTAASRILKYFRQHTKATL